MDLAKNSMSSFVNRTPGIVNMVVSAFYFFWGEQRLLKNFHGVLTVASLYTSRTTVSNNVLFIGLLEGSSSCGRSLNSVKEPGDSLPSARKSQYVSSASLGLGNEVLGPIPVSFSISAFVNV